jgi:uncharacterized protein (DUF169 family)
VEGAFHGQARGRGLESEGARAESLCGDGVDAVAEEDL